ncbi:unnamed protein product [Lactuca saligna]|uniref:Carbohydrate kinase PfkB domain-containing protein n=1 Tax=Lactuca saligna TaxID=75948 RepID=A0AA36ELV3_LACSI|nr:unnamed protein product [Lactuca saligna]
MLDQENISVTNKKESNKRLWEIHRRKNRFRPPETIAVFDTRQLRTVHRWQPFSLPVPCSRALSPPHRVSPSLPVTTTASVQRFRTKMLSSVTQTESPIVLGFGGVGIRSTSLKVQGGGNAGNALTCAARLGLNARLISKVCMQYANT